MAVLTRRWAAGPWAVLAALVAACTPVDQVAVAAGDPAGTATWPGEPLVVVATFTVLADVVAQVGGRDVTVTSITGPGMNVHGYEPTPDDLRRVAEADLVVANGLGLEVWLHDLVDPLGVTTVVVTDDIEPLPVHGSAAERGGLVHNPHAWMSPVAGREYVAAVAEALAAVDPAHATEYVDRAAELADDLRAVESDMTERLASLPADRRRLVTCEGAFSYLARDLGLQEAYLWPVNAERQGTPRQAARVIDAVREGAVPAVFCEWTVSATAQRQVARETGARFAGELYVDSLTGPDGPAPTYLDLLRYDADLIVAGLTGAAA
jgi:manganese transport system substrate-binding protein